MTGSDALSGAWLHGSRVCFDDGALVLPPAVTGVPSASWGPAKDDALYRKFYRDDRVSIFNSEGLAVINFVGSYTFTGRDSHFIYEVLPLGPLEMDLDPSALPAWRLVEKARIMRMLWDPRTQQAL